MSIEAHFNGEVFVPDGPVNLPLGQRVKVDVPRAENGSSEVKPGPDFEAILAQLSTFTANEKWPADGAAQLDHYLYGTPKVP